MIFWLTVNSNSSQLSQHNELASVQTPAPAAEETEIPKSEFYAPLKRGKYADKVNTEIETPKDKSPAAQEPPRSDKNQSSADARVSKPAKPTAIFSTIVLPLGLTRDDGASSKTFDIAAKTDFVNLQLNLEVDNSFISFFAVLETVEGRQVWNGKILKSAKTKNQNAAHRSRASFETRRLHTHAQRIVKRQHLRTGGRLFIHY